MANKQMEQKITKIIEQLAKAFELNVIDLAIDSENGLISFSVAINNGFDYFKDIQVSLKGETQTEIANEIVKAWSQQINELILEN